MKKLHNPRATAAVAIAAAAALGRMQAVPTGKENNQLETLDISTQDGKDFPWAELMAINGMSWCLPNRWIGISNEICWRAR